MKNLIRIFFPAALLLLASCDPGDIEIKKLNRGEGIWQIAGLRYQQYDSTGANVVADSTRDNPGELVFFKTTTLNALYDYYLVVANMYQSNGDIISNPGEVFYDGNRASLAEGTGPVYDFPDELEGVWTVEDDGRKKQVWTIYQLRGNSSLQTKITMTLEKGARDN